MSLIEYLEHDNWQDVLKRNFKLALDALAKKDYRIGSSAMDDMRSWLSIGGVSRVKMRLNEQMKMRRFSPERTVAINQALETLTQENRDQLLSLMAIGTIKVNQDSLLTTFGLSELQFETFVDRIRTGENPFEEWMLEQGRPEIEIMAVYRLIDDWLMKNGLKYSN